MLLAERMRVETEHLASCWAKHRPRPPEAPVISMFLLAKSFLALGEGWNLEEEEVAAAATVAVDNISSCSSSSSSSSSSSRSNHHHHDQQQQQQQQQQ